MVDDLKQKSAVLPTHDVIRLLFDLAPHIQITGHVPGKITMRFSLSGLGVLQHTDIENIDQTIPGILKARTSLWKRSVVIEYDENQVPFSIWEDLARSDHHPEQRKILRDRLRMLIEKQTPQRS
jgi:hypothetical protein